MIIGGLQPCSLSDFPGQVAAVIFCQGCNFRCPFCHNGALLPEQERGRLEVDQVLTFLAQRRRQLGGVVVSGGEPCLQRDLPEFIRDVRALGLRVKLDTNGSRPAMLAELLAADLLDYLAMDIKAPMDKYAMLAGKAVDEAALRQSMLLIQQSGVAHHFRTTEVKGLLAKVDMAAIAAMIPTGSTYIVQPFVAAHALRADICGGQI